jgi:hypothetical protein
MTKYRVLAEYATLFELFIDAKNEEEAWKMAGEAHFENFEEISGSKWDIYDIFEADEEEL